MRSLKSVPLIGGFAATLVLVVGILLAVSSGEDGPRGALVSLGALTSLLSLVACMVVVRRCHGRERWAWLMLATTVVLWFVSSAVWGVPFADPRGGVAGYVGLFAGYLAAAGAMLISLDGSSRKDWPLVWREVGDVAVVGICAVLITSITVFRPFVLGEVPPVPGGVLLVPVLSFALAAFAQLVRRLVRRPGVEFDMLALAFGVVALSDVVSVALLATEARPVWLVAGGYAASSVLVTAAAASALGMPGSFAPALERLGSRVVAAVPEVIVIASAVVAIAYGLRTWVDWTVISIGAAVALWRAASQAYDAKRTRGMLEREVSERTAELRRLTRRYARILDTVREGIIGLDQLGRVSFVNASAATYLGLEPEAAIGRRVCDVLCESGNHSACSFVAVAAGHGRVEGWRTSLRRADGSHIPVELDAAPKIWPGAGEAEGAVLAFRDITEQLAVEQHKQQFVSSVSHELRTPLASIRGVLELLGCGDAGELSPAAYRLVATAERGAQRLTRLVGDIIDAERLATGDFDVVPVRQEIGPVVRDAVGSLRPLARQADVEVRLTQVDDVDALCDADRIEQALVNLIGNAVKFSERNGVVEVAVRAGGAEVEVSVRDHGRGIPAADLPLVFDRFRQVRVTDATEKGGTGLGLTITRSIVERHGGHIRVESVEGEGATFVFTLPRALKPLPAIDLLPRGSVGVDHAS